MNEHEWLTTDNVKSMIDWLGGPYLAGVRGSDKDGKPYWLTVTSRKLKLWAEASHSLGFCTRQIYEIGDKFHNHMARCVRNKPNNRFERTVANMLRDTFGNPWHPIDIDRQHCTWLTQDVLTIARDTQNTSLCNICHGTGFIGSAAPVQPGWIGAPNCPECQGTAPKNTLLIDPLSLLVLADAVEEAGCNQQEILDHLRSPGNHYLGMWSLDLILGYQ